MAQIKDISDLKPDPRNANKGTPRGHGIIEQSVRQRGAGRSGLAAKDGTMIAGGQTLLKMAELGVPIKPVHTRGDEWVVVIRDDIEPGSEEATMMAIEDNRSSEVGLDWDASVLAALGEEVDLSGLFRDDELAALLAQEAVDIGGAGDEFDTTPQEGPTRTQAGDLWLIDGGRHRLLVGDCTDAANVERLMGGEKIGSAILDPPYGMRLDTDWTAAKGTPGFVAAKKTTAGNKYDRVEGDDEDYDASPVALVLKDVDEQFWFGADYYSATLGDTMHSGAWLVWDKREDENLDKAIGSCFELIWSRQKHKRDFLRHKWCFIFGTEHEPQRGRQHPNQKPVRLYEDLMNRYTAADAIVVDFYAGSGTTLAAAHSTGRRAYLMELLPKYADVILRRAEAAGLSVARRDE